jgi:hypothetical protein
MIEADEDDFIDMDFDLLDPFETTTEVRCTKCGKLLFRTFNITNDGALRFDKKVCPNACEYTKRKVNAIEIKCYHRVKQDGKNVPCNTINRIEI